MSHDHLLVLSTALLFCLQNSMSFGLFAQVTGNNLVPRTFPLVQGKKPGDEVVPVVGLFRVPLNLITKARLSVKLEN